MCYRANQLKIQWYMSRAELDRLLYEAHRRECDVCRREMPELEAE